MHTVLWAGNLTWWSSGCSLPQGLHPVAARERHVCEQDRDEIRAPQRRQDSVGHICLQMQEPSSWQSDSNIHVIPNVCNGAVAVDRPTQQHASCNDVEHAFTGFCIDACNVDTILERRKVAYCTCFSKTRSIDKAGYWEPKPRFTGGIDRHRRGQQQIGWCPR